MDLQDFRIFSRVAAVQNLSAVGHEMGLTPGTISKRLQALEDHLQVRLFERNTRSMRITAEGQTFLEHVERILSDVEMARASVGNYAQNPRGELRICAPNVLGRYELAPMLSAFLHRYPEIDLRVELHDRLGGRLLEEGYDLALRIDGLADSTLIAKRLGPIEQILTASPGYLEAHGAPETPDDLGRHACLVLGDATQWSFTRADSKRGELQHVRVEPRMRSNSAVILHRSAVEGHGILRCSGKWVSCELANGKLVRVLPDYQVADRASIYAIYSGARHVSPRLRALLDFLGEWFRDRSRQAAESDDDKVLDEVKGAGG